MCLHEVFVIILIRPHYFASASPRMVRDDSICHYHTKLTYFVHIWHKLCVWVRPLCTLAAGRGVHISSTGKGHTKQRSRTSTKSASMSDVDLDTDRGKAGAGGGRPPPVPPDLRPHQ